MKRERILDRLRKATETVSSLEVPHLPDFPMIDHPEKTFQEALEAVQGVILNGSTPEALASAFDQILAESGAKEICWENADLLDVYGIPYNRSGEAVGSSGRSELACFSMNGEQGSFPGNGESTISPAGDESNNPSTDGEPTNSFVGGEPDGTVFCTFHPEMRFQTPMSVFRRPSNRESLSLVEISVSEALWAIAETGSIFESTGPGKGRILPILVPTHVVLLKRSRILPTQGDFFQIPELGKSGSAQIVMTGPSRTADIEKVLTLGVHGPRQLYVILV